jgi:hypothetical protein
MTMSTPFSTSTAPPRRAVASFASYEEAERAVDRLADQRFPVEHVAIVGRDLKYVEQVTGRMSYARAALGGAMSGAVIGALIGWLFGVFNWFEPIVSAFWLALDGLWFGAVLGALFAVILHALLGGRRDFASVRSTTADRYEVMVDEPFADDARRLLAPEIPDVAHLDH